MSFIYRNELIQYIREYMPYMKYVSKMNKKELKEIYDQLTASKTKEEQKEDVVEISVDFSKCTRSEMIYDIKLFLKLQGKYLSGLKSKSKQNLLNIIKVLKVDTHYTEADKSSMAGY